MSQYVFPFRQGQKIIELGGGDRPSFHPNVDSDPNLPNVDIVADLEQRFPIEDEGYDGVYGHFVMEHIQWRRVPFFIGEVYRILKTGGMAVLITNNLQAQAQEIMKRGRVEIDECCMIFGGQSREGDFHKSGWSPAYVDKMFRDAGFTQVSIKSLPTAGGHTDMIIEALKGEPADPVLRIQRSEWYRKIQRDIKGAAESGLRINAGSFTVMLPPPWINWDILDMSAYAKEKGFMFEQVDVRCPLPLKDGQASFINTSHLIEHLSVKDGMLFLKECHRILEPKGRLRIGTPDLKKLVEVYLKGEMNQFSAHQPDEYRKSPSQADRLWRILAPGHKTIYDIEAISSLLKEAGFEPAQAEYDQETDMFPDHSLYVEGVRSIPAARPLKIALISTAFFGLPPKAYSGLERIVWDLAVALGELGNEVTVIAPKGSQAPPGGHVIETIDAVNTVECSWLELEMKSFEIYRDRLSEFDIIHSHDWFAPAYLYKSNHPSAKVCHTHHGHLSWRTRPPGVLKLNLIAISRWMQETYRQQGWESRFAYNGIDLGAYQFRKKKGDRLLYVGRFDSFKQPHVAVQVAKRLGMGLDLVGGTFIRPDHRPYFESLKAMCDGMQIKMHPDAPHEVKVKLMQDAKCLIFPSRMGEPFGLVALEAMSCGTPVVATNDGAIGEVVEDGKSGFVCETYRIDGLKYTVVKDEVESLSQAVKKIDSIKPKDCRIVAQKFSRENMAKNYMHLYNEIIMENNEW